jgi:PAS domain S-box-containing protein
MITDADLEQPGPRILYVNPAFTKMTGYKAEEVIGKNPRLLQGPDTDRKVLDSIRNNLTQGKTFYGCAINYKKDGSPFWNEWHIEPIWNEDGSVAVYLGMQRDISKHKDLEEALMQKNAALREVLQQIEYEKNRIKDDVATNLNEIVMPALYKLKRKGTRLDVKYIDIVESSLNDLTSSFGSNVSERKLKLSPREIEISNMIKNGLSNKEISSMLNISIKTIETHRNKIRKKLGVINKDVNLTTYLQTL